MIFSRNSENLSPKYPDIINRLPKVTVLMIFFRWSPYISQVTKDNTTSYVLDCEAVAWDVEKKCILPFQVLSTRKRKDVAEKDIAVQVCVYAFDLLYLNGEPVTQRTFKERRQLIQDHFNEVEGEFYFAKYMNATSIEEMQTFLDDSVAGLLLLDL